MEPAIAPKMTWDEYLDFEGTSEVKHEFHDGELFAMVGVTRAHAEIASNLHYALRGHLGRSDCRAYMSDFKVRIEASNRGLYPDVVVDCTSSRDPGDRFATETPLIAEVLSKSTEAYDRGDKFEYYKQLPSLEEYVLLDSKAVSVDRFRKGSDGRWTMEARLGPGEVLVLESVGLTVPVDELYAQSGVE